MSILVVYIRHQLSKYTNIPDVISAPLLSAANSPLVSAGAAPPLDPVEGAGGPGGGGAGARGAAGGGAAPPYILAATAVAASPWRER